MRLIYQAEMNCHREVLHWHIWIVSQETPLNSEALFEGQIIASWLAENIGYRGGIYSSRNWQIETIG